MLPHRGKQQGKRGGIPPAQLWVWGNASTGSLGLGNAISRSSPTQIGTLTDWVSISAGSGFDGVGVRKGGTLWTWGKSSYGANGGQGDVINRSSPTIVGALSNWKVAWGTRSWLYGAGATFGIKQNGTLWAWGDWFEGTLGNNTAGAAGGGVSSPVQIGTATDWVTGGGKAYGGLAIKNNGSLWSWGNGENGQHGNNHILNISSPVQVGALNNWYQVAGTFSSVHAIKTDGTLWGWGNASNGGLGINSTIARSSPTQVGTDTTWAQVSAGGNIAGFAIKTNGTLWSWGVGTNGISGRNSTTSTSSPVQIGSDTKWKKVVGGLNHVVAIKTDGTLWAWGEAANGLLGINNNILRSSPTQVGSDTKWIDVDTNRYGTFALKLP